MKFTKMHGAGNDFVVIDDRSMNFSEHDTSKIQKISARGTGVGCEGVILIRLADAFTDCDFKMIFLNPDGSRASMCGNASRCLALFAYEKGIGGRHQRFGTDAGIIRADVLDVCEGQGSVCVHMTEPKERVPLVTMNLCGGRSMACFKVDTGVPHAVWFVDDIAAVDVAGDGSFIRFAEVFAPQGVNVDFVQIVENGPSLMRTYERGVEAESGACGTGAVAAGIAMAEKLGISLPVSLRVKSGDVLVVNGQRAESGLCHSMTLTGPACKVFEGHLNKRWLEATP